MAPWGSSQTPRTGTVHAEPAVQLNARRGSGPTAKPGEQIARRGKFAGAKPGKRLRGRR